MTQLFSCKVMKSRNVLSCRQAVSLFSRRQNSDTRNYASRQHGQNRSLSALVGGRPNGNFSVYTASFISLKGPAISLFPSESLLVRNFNTHLIDETNEEVEGLLETESLNEDDASSGRVKLDRREPLFDKVNRVIDVPVGELHPLDVTFTCADLMVDCCKLHTLEGMKYAQDMLDRLLAEKRHFNRERQVEDELPMVIPAKVFEKFMFGWAKMATHVDIAVPRMKEVLDLMAQEDEYDTKVRSGSSSETLNPDDKMLSCQPTVYTFNVMLRGLADAAHRSPDLAFEAESVLDTMAEYHATKGWHTKPNTRSFSHVITAFAKTHADFAGKYAERLLERMKQVHKAEKERYELEFGSPYNTMDPKANVIQIVTPDRYVYSAVISAHANSGQRTSAERAHALLLELVENKETHVLLDAAVFSSAISAWAKVARNRQANGPKARYEAAEHAEQILLLMMDLAETEKTQAGGDISSETLSDEWEGYYEDEESENKAGGSPSLAPTTTVYNAVLDAWASSDTREAAFRAEALLQQMLEASMTDAAAVQPDRISFNTVLNAWARFSPYDVEAPQKAEDLMNLMYDLYHSGRLDERAKPDKTSYATVINAWARGDAGDVKTAKARLLLDTMLNKYEAGEHDLKPNIVAYTSVLNAAAHSSPSSQPAEGFTDEEGFGGVSEDADPYAIALQTYEELWNDSFDLKLKPDHLTFATMLAVIAKHTDVTSAERRQMVERIFDDSCARGQVSALVIKALKEACPSIDLLERLMGSRKLARNLKSIDELPSNWTSRIGHSKHFRKVETKRRQAQGKGKKRRRKRPDDTKNNTA